MSWRRVCLLVGALLWLPPGLGAPDSPPHAERRSDAQAQEAALRERLRALRVELEKSESERAEARDALRASEAAISQAQRRLRELRVAQQHAREQLGIALAERRRAETALAQERQTLGRLVREHYLLGQNSPWALLFSGINPNDIGRQLVYLGYIARARHAVMQQLQAHTETLQHSIANERARGEELATLVADERTQQASLQSEQAKRTEVLRRVSAQVKEQRKAVGILERDAARMNTLVQRLSKLIADEERAARARLSAPPPPRVPRAESDEGTAAIVANTPFAHTKGKLRWPVRGELIGRYGQARGDARTTWKGVFIATAEGTDVRAIAAGRVVFADWMRGFGNLLILDHGDQYLSIYGGNETLLKQEGQAVRAGEVLATVGSSGGADRTGLYFELRYRGEPFDPLSWVR